MSKLRAASLALTVIVAGCSSVDGTEYRPEQAKSRVPDGWNGRLEGAIRAEELDPEQLATWWTTLGDETLDSLVSRATAANLDIRTADVQLRQARSQRNIAAGANKPSISAGGAGARTGTSGNAGELYSASLDATWEIDVFGGIAASIEAAEADLQAVQEARRDVLVTILAEVALNYTELRTLERRREVTLANLETQEEQLDILSAQLQQGATTRLELDRARSNYETTKARVPSFDQQIIQSRNRLAVLLGKVPGSLDAELKKVETRLSPPPVQIAVGVPAEVLRRRPDVRRAERTLAAETARVGVAIAELYPKFALVGTAGLESPSLSSLFRSASGVFSFGPRMNWNIYDGGRIREQIEVRSAEQENALIDYERTILAALEEVQNSIAAYTQEQIRYRSLQAAAAAATDAASLAQQRYDAGVSAYLDVLDATRTRLSAEDELASSEGQIITNLIRLYKALGGGWSPSEAEESR